MNDRYADLRAALSMEPTSPETIRKLLKEREALTAENERLHAEVDALREVLAAMLSWFPSADTYRRLGFDPKTPTQVLKEAKAVLFKETLQ